MALFPGTTRQFMPFDWKLKVGSVIACSGRVRSVTNRGQMAETLQTKRLLIRAVELPFPTDIVALSPGAMPRFGVCPLPVPLCPFRASVQKTRRRSERDKTCAVMPSAAPTFISLKRNKREFPAALGMTGQVDSFARSQGPLFTVFAAGQRTQRSPPRRAARVSCVALELRSVKYLDPEVGIVESESRFSITRISVLKCPVSN